MKRIYSFLSIVLICSTICVQTNGQSADQDLQNNPETYAAEDLYTDQETIELLNTLYALLLNDEGIFSSTALYDYSDAYGTVSSSSATGSNSYNEESAPKDTSEGFFIDAANKRIVNVGAPVKPTDAVNKEYVDKILKRLEEIEVKLGTRVRDADGNMYPTVRIGNQIWMAENLKTTRYANGDEIPLVTDNAAWIKLQKGAYCYYNNDKKYIDIYGNLYNYYAVTDNRNICPLEWHIPSDVEWTELETYLGGKKLAGGKLKQTGNKLWLPPNVGASNTSGFTALPGGSRYDIGSYIALGEYGYWWTSTIQDQNYAWYRLVYYNDTEFIRYNYHKSLGFSVRCIKDKVGK